MRERHRLLVQVLDVRGENTNNHICATCNQRNNVRVPIGGKDGGPDGFLEKLRDPLVALLAKKRITIALVKIGQGWKNGRRRRSYPAPMEMEAVPERSPADEGGGTIGTQQHQRRLPLQPTGFLGGCLNPHVRVPILRSGGDPV